VPATAYRVRGQIGEEEDEHQASAAVHEAQPVRLCSAPLLTMLLRHLPVEAPTQTGVLEGQPGLLAR
jgi:hypothetical protein